MSESDAQPAPDPAAAVFDEPAVALSVVPDAPPAPVEEAPAAAVPTEMTPVAAPELAALPVPAEAPPAPPAPEAPPAPVAPEAPAAPVAETPAAPVAPPVPGADVVPPLRVATIPSVPPPAPAAPDAAVPAAVPVPGVPAAPAVEATAPPAPPAPPVAPGEPAVLVPTGQSAPAAEATPAAEEPAEAAEGTVAIKDLTGTTTMQLIAKKLRIGEVLVDMGLIDQGQLDHALRIQQNTGARLGKVLIAERLVSSTDIAKALARRLTIEYVDIGAMALSDETLALIPPELCTRYDVVPIGEQGPGLLVAMADPTNVFALDDIRLITGRDVRVVVASPDAVDIILSRIVSLDDANSSDAPIVDDWATGHVQLESIRSGDSSGDAAITLVNQLITQGVIHGVSDLHFEPQAEDMVIRFRKDGVLQYVTTVPAKFRNSIASRLKIMANLDISERRHPQSGRVDLRVEDKPIELRVSSLPTVYGESIVLRVLDKSNVVLDMAHLDFLPDQLDKLRHCYAQPYGCLIVAGPSGSGRTTTLYGAVSEMHNVERKIITVEDPVEHRLSGITQVQAHPKTGLTLSLALASVLCCDPDVVMIGDMQDRDTAALGIEAANTGHLVLASLQTNSAPSAITRLAEMEIEPYLVSSSVLGVLAQRLARRLCSCAEEYQPTREQVFEAGFPRWALDQYDDEPFTLRRPVGCDRCASKGYHGRVGIHEIMLMSKEIAQLAIANASAEDIAVVAKQQGMIDLWDDGIHKVILGHTTIEELRRVVQH